MFHVRGRAPMRHGLLFAWLLWMAWPAGGVVAEEVWVLVDTQALTLDVMRGSESVLHFSQIAIGRAGAGRDKLKGDQQTPLGKYRIAWFNPDSRFHFFIGLDYPLREQVERAFVRGRLDQKQRERLLRALSRGRLPPQDSALGGAIGIHGLGAADPRLHEMANWTEGCVAVTDEQIDLLRRHVQVGTTVLIR